MEIEKWEVLQLLGTTALRRYKVPTYQRRYEWTDDRWHDLWRDLAVLYEEEAAKPHFLGIVLVAASSSVAFPRNFEVIDGQQRITTLLLLLAAVRDALAEDRTQELAFEIDPLLYLTDGDGSLTQLQLLEAQLADHDALQRALHGKWRGWFPLSGQRTAGDRPLFAYQYFRYAIWRGLESLREPEKYVVPLPRSATDKALPVEDFWTSHLAKTGQSKDENRIDLDRLRQIIRMKLHVLLLTIQEHDEDPVVVFDAINGKRTEFAQWDHSKTYIFMRLGDRAERVLEEAWHPVEKELEKLKYAGLTAKVMDQFIYDYLIARGEQQFQKTVNRRRGHEQLRARIRRLSQGMEPSPEALEAFLTNDFLRAARCFPSVVSDKPALHELVRPVDEQRLSTEVRTRLDQIRWLSSGPPNPASLFLIDAWYGGALALDALERGLRVLEAFLARHVLAGTELSPFRSRFMSVMAALNRPATAEGQSSPVDRLLAELIADVPSDDDIRNRHLTDRPRVYGSLQGAQLAALFRGIEMALAGPGSNPLPYGTAPELFSVEHVYPQSCAHAPNEAWRRELESWGRLEQAAEMGERVDSLGNLALLSNSANKKLKAASFTSKRRAFRQEDPEVLLPLLNHMVVPRGHDKWGLDEMDDHSARLIDAAMLRWPVNLEA